MIVRPYEPEDRAAVIALWTETWPELEAHNDPASSLDRKLADSPNLLLVADDDGLVGTVMCGYDGHRGWIYRLAVIPSRRDKGLGRLLLAEAEERLAEIGCIKVNLQIRDSAPELVAYYESLGYQVEARISMGKLLA